MTDPDRDLRHEVEVLLRDRIKFVAEVSSGDRRVLKIAGYKQAAADVVELLIGGDGALTMRRNLKPFWVG